VKLNNLKKTLAIIVLVAFSIISISSTALSQAQARKEINIPDIIGYQTLKCDFHMHTIFSDGDVWPTVRVEEAWLEGLDAIAITDHIEGHPNKKDIQFKTHNRSYEIAKPRADQIGLLLIRGAEITRSMPPGHFNALFLKDVDPLDTPDWRDAFKAAVEQDAFIIWNHPGWRQPDEIPIWYDEHSELYDKGVFKGIELVNWYSYYPLAQQWTLDKNLTMIGNSDIHPPIHFGFDFGIGEHRPMTLVFVKNKTVDGIKDALLNRRTAVYYENLLIGIKKYLKPIFDNSISVSTSEFSIKGKNKVMFTITNNSDLTFELKKVGEVEHLSFPDEITIHANRTVFVQLRGKSKTFSGEEKIKLPYEVKNLLVTPQDGLPVQFVFNINFKPQD
jgi:3',5'-nucleoside bisphosphate phosphatase